MLEYIVVEQEELLVEHVHTSVKMLQLLFEVSQSLPILA